MASDIQITSFSAVPGVGVVALGAMAAPPAGFEDLSYMQPAKLRFFRNTSNNAATATLIGESTSGVLSYETTVTYFYFAAAVDPAGNEGPRSAGVQCVPKTAAPGPNSVGTTELKDDAVTSAKIANLAVGTAAIANAAITNAKIGNAEITDAKIYSMSAAKLTAGTVTVTISFTSPIIDGGEITGSTFQTRATGARLWIDRSANALLVFNASDQIRAGIGGSGNVSAVFTNYANSEAVNVTATLTSANAHAIRAKNSGSGGGEAVLGVSSGGGGWALNAQTGGVYSGGGYHPFTGMHEALVRKDADLAVGDIACVKRVFARNGLDNVLAEVERSVSISDKRVIGVVSKRGPVLPFSQIAALGPEPRDRKLATPVRKFLAEHYDIVTVNALGEGQMLVCGRGGDIGAGDYIVSSDLPGKGQRLDMDQPVTFGLQAAIVAQTMEPVAFDSPDQVKRVAVFYRCG